MASVLLCAFLLFSFTSGIAAPLPPNTPTLHLRYPNTSWVTPGETLLKSATHPLPLIGIGTLNPNRTYLLLFVDLDVVYGATSTVILHWYQPNMVAAVRQHKHDRKQEQKHLYLAPTEQCKHNNNILINTTSGAEYIAPQPPPRSHHRYVYLLFEQHDSYEFPGCFGYIFPPTVEARVGFDMRQFMAVAGLKSPVAGNFFFVEYDGPGPQAATVEAGGPSWEGETTTTTTGQRQQEMMTMARRRRKRMSRASPTATWLRSAPCSEGETATASSTPTSPGNM